VSKTIVSTVMLGGAPIENQWASEHGYTLRFLTEAQAGESLAMEAAEADALLVSYERVGEQVLSRLPKCLVVGRYGIGVDNIDLDSATKHGICVVHQPAYCVNEVATQALALLLASVRRVVEIDGIVHDGYWGSCDLPIHRMNGRTLGLIGFGRIARNLALKMKGFDLRIVAHDPYVTKPEFIHYGVQQVPLEILLRDSDYISVHCPLTPESRHLLGKPQFDRMKKGAILINVSRGGLISEQALTEALTTGQLAAAGLDVLEPEPPEPGNPLFTLPNVIVTHHMGGYSLEARVEKSETLIRDLELIFSGQWPENLANKALKDSKHAPRFLAGLKLR
jgi:D-3-phosphoglycerate dehydrogenase